MTREHVRTSKYEGCHATQTAAETGTDRGAGNHAEREKRGFGPGLEGEDWRQAEQEVLARVRATQNKL